MLHKYKSKFTMMGLLYYNGASTELRLHVFTLYQIDLRRFKLYPIGLLFCSHTKGSRILFKKNADFLDDFSVNARIADIFNKF